MPSGSNKPNNSTPYAVKTALPHLASEGRTLVLYGDVPLIDVETLETLLEAAGNEVGLLTDVPADPAGLGRIIRDGSGSVTAIVEEKDASATQKTIREINTGILVLPNAKLENWLNSLSSNNAQGEYYLTDLIAKAVADGIKVRPVRVRASHLAARREQQTPARRTRTHLPNRTGARIAQSRRDPARSGSFRFAG